VNAKQKRTPKIEKDVRRVLQDKNLTALAIAAPDHWHALATIWACQAGKHVYVEKPISHNLIEGRRMVEAARKYQRVVQVGTQRRSSSHVASAAEFIKSGKLGKVPFARAWIAGNRKSIGKTPDSSVPQGVDYDLWLGPAPAHSFNIWAKKDLNNQDWGISFHGEKGMLTFDNAGWRVTGGEEASDKGGYAEKEHLRNFLDCIRSGNRPNADIEEGHKSTRLCHLGNIAYRTGHTLHFDAATETICDDPAATKLLGRTYRKPFVFPETV
jgi:predicted dehydrogenase